MKIAALLVSYVFSSVIVYGQDVAGEWKGQFDYGGAEFTRTEIFITFYRINDSIYEGFSKTILKEDTAICVLTGGFQRKNLLYLEEIRMVKEFNGVPAGGGLQLFKLKYRKRKKSITLSGTWTSREQRGGSGNITLEKLL